MHNLIIFYIGDDDVSKKEELGKNKNGIFMRVYVAACVCICVYACCVCV